MVAVQRQTDVVRRQTRIIAKCLRPMGAGHNNNNVLGHGLDLGLTRGVYCETHL